MKISKLLIKNIKNPLFNEDLEFLFKDHTIVYSRLNSIGKTTLVRFILFSLGFKIPSTKNINLFYYETKLFYSSDKEEFEITRYENNVKIFRNNELLKTFNLNNQENADSLIVFVFGLKNASMVKSILGCFYVDQDSGWEMSIHGMPIQYNKFDIIEYVSSFIDNSLADINQEITNVKQQITKYNALLKIINIGIEKENSNYLKQESIFAGEYSELKNQQSSLIFYKSNIESSITKVEELLFNNESIVDNIEQYNIIVKRKNEDVPFVLKKEDIYNYDINRNVLMAQLSDYKSQLKKINEELTKIKIKLKNATPLVSAKEVSDNAIESLRASNISEESLSIIIEELKRDLIKYKNRRYEIIKSNNCLYDDLSETIFKIMSDLGHHDKLIKKDLLAVNAKTYFSGTELHDICLAYTLGCVQFIKNKLDITLPIIIDSPGSGERIIENLDKLVDYVLNNFSDHQIIISTTSNIERKRFDWIIEAYGFIFENKYNQYGPND